MLLMTVGVLLLTTACVLCPKDLHAFKILSPLHSMGVAFNWMMTPPCQKPAESFFRIFTEKEFLSMSTECAQEVIGSYNVILIDCKVKGINFNAKGLGTLERTGAIIEVQDKHIFWHNTFNNWTPVQHRPYNLRLRRQCWTGCFSKQIQPTVEV